MIDEWSYWCRMLEEARAAYRHNHLPEYANAVRFAQRKIALCERKMFGSVKGAK